jgi:hypothetical protein
MVTSRDGCLPNGNAKARRMNAARWSLTRAGRTVPGRFDDESDILGSDVAVKSGWRHESQEWGDCARNVGRAVYANSGNLHDVVRARRLAVATARSACELLVDAGS